MIGYNSQHEVPVDDNATSDRPRAVADGWNMHDTALKEVAMSAEEPGAWPSLDKTSEEVSFQASEIERYPGVSPSRSDAYPDPQDTKSEEETWKDFDHFLYTRGTKSANADLRDNQRRQLELALGGATLGAAALGGTLAAQGKFDRRDERRDVVTRKVDSAVNLVPIAASTVAPLAMDAWYSIKNNTGIPEEDEFVRRLDLTKRLRDASSQIFDTGVDISQIYDNDDYVVGGLRDAFRPVSSSMDRSEKSIEAPRLSLGPNKSFRDDMSMYLTDAREIRPGINADLEAQAHAVSKIGDRNSRLSKLVNSNAFSKIGPAAQVIGLASGVGGLLNNRYDLLSPEETNALTYAGYGAGVATLPYAAEQIRNLSKEHKILSLLRQGATGADLQDVNRALAKLRLRGAAVLVPAAAPFAAPSISAAISSRINRDQS